VMNVSKGVFVGEAVGKEEPWRETAEVEESFVVGQEGVHSAASPEEAIAHMGGMVHKAEACRGCGMVGEEIVVAGSNSHDRVACSHCTSAQLEGIADSGCNSSSVPYLAAYSAALPADDDRSSCRLREMLPNRSRAASGWELRVAVCGFEVVVSEDCFRTGRLSTHRRTSR
jgi:hypothetical protein